MIIDILTQGRMSSPTFTRLQHQHALCHEHRKPLPRLSQGAGRDQRIPYDVLAGHAAKAQRFTRCHSQVKPKKEESPNTQTRKHVGVHARDRGDDRRRRQSVASYVTGRVERHLQCKASAVPTSSQGSGGSGSSGTSWRFQADTAMQKSLKTRLGAGGAGAYLEA